MKIILGSQSEWRKQVLEEMGYEFEVMASNIDEKSIRYEDPRQLVLALANAKADALVPRIQEDALLITADQVVAWNNEIREKPEDEQELRYFLRTYHEYPVEVINGICVINTATGKRASAIDYSTLRFREIPEDIIAQAAQREDLYRRAGGFAIQDSLFIPYIARLEGTPDSVIGLPKELTERLMKEAQE